MGAGSTRTCGKWMELLEFLKVFCRANKRWLCKMSGKGEMHMEKDLCLIVLALCICAVFKTDLLLTAAFVDMADRLYRLLRYVYIAANGSKHKRSPSSSAKRDGRPHHRG